MSGKSKLNYSGRKFLTICQGGQVRSVGMKYALTYRFKLGTAIAVGTEGNRGDDIMSFYDWADHIILMDRSLASNLPKFFEYKKGNIESSSGPVIHVCDVGPDNFGNPFHPNLQAKIDREIPRLLIEFRNIKSEPSLFHDKDTTIKWYPDAEME